MIHLSNNNRKRIKQLLKEDKRLDGRSPFDYREISVESGVSNKAEGSARVRIGKTEVIVGVKLETQEPYPDHSDEGTMMVGMEFSPICGARYEPGPPKIDAIEVSRVVDRGVRESKFIDFKKLCIKKGKKVWSILIDIYCINDDGNVFDASALGVVVALQLARLPAYDADTDTINYNEQGEKLPLSANVPLAMTFYKIGDKILFDPTREEQDASEARVTLALSQPKKEKLINSMQKGDITPISRGEMELIIKSAEQVYDKLFGELEKKIKK